MINTTDKMPATEWELVMERMDELGAQIIAHLDSIETSQQKTLENLQELMSIKNY